MITRKALPRRTFLRGMGTAVGASVPGCHGARLGAAPLAGKAARPHGVRLRAQRHHHGQLEPGLRGQTRGELPRILKPLEPFKDDILHARQPDAQYRARAARWRGRSRPLLRLVPHRHPGQEDAGRYQGRRLVRPDRRQPDGRRRRASRRSNSAWKMRARRAIAIPATPARTPTTWPGAARRSRCRRSSIRARCSSASSATASMLSPEARARQAEVPPQHSRFRHRRHAASWKPTLGPTDRRKLDEYLSSIREVERQIENAEKDNTQIDPHMEKPYGVPADFAEHFKLMTDMMTIAFQADLTRVVTFLVTHEGTSRPYREIGIPDGHHPLHAPPQSAGPDGEGGADQQLSHAAVRRLGGEAEVHQGRRRHACWTTA